MIRSLLESGDLDGINTGIDLAVQLGEIPVPDRIRYRRQGEKGAVSGYALADALILKYGQHNGDDAARFEAWVSRFLPEEEGVWDDEEDQERVYYYRTLDENDKTRFWIKINKSTRELK